MFNTLIIAAAISSPQFGVYATTTVEHVPAPCIGLENHPQPGDGVEVEGYAFLEASSGYLLVNSYLTAGDYTLGPAQGSWQDDDGFDGINGDVFFVSTSDERAAEIGTAFCRVTLATPTTIDQVPVGDANRDGAFNSGDLIEVFRAAEYEDDATQNSSWATGDWNIDREFDSRDLVLAMQAGSYETSAAASRAVPEPAAALSGFCGVVIAISSLRSRLARRVAP